jgi:hypothetical protein
MALMQLIYVSQLVGQPDAALMPIHTSAVKHNTNNGVTGMLLYFKGSFMQVLEGERDAVMVTYQRVQADRRHQHCKVLVEEDIAQRHFPTWSMGLCCLGDADFRKFPQFDLYFQDGFAFEKIQANPGIALSMLQAFGRGAA